MISIDDWREIENFVNKALAQTGEPFSQGKVVKSDPVNKLVWLKEFGDQPIPLVSFDYQVKYSYVNADGATVIKKTRPYTRDVEILVPRVGDVVLIGRQMGSSRLPKCLGVVKSKNYIVPEGS